MFFLFFSPTRDGMPEHIRDFLDREHITWNEMEKLLNGFRAIKPDITVGTLLTFLYIARRTSNESSDIPISLKVLSDAIGMSYQSAARHCDLLSEGVSGNGGLGWIEKISNPQERGKAMQLSYGGLFALLQVFEKLRPEGQTGE